MSMPEIATTILSWSMWGVPSACQSASSSVR